MNNVGCILTISAFVFLPLTVDADHHISAMVSDEAIAQQKTNLAQNTQGQGFGPQSPRDIDSSIGLNPVVFSEAPAHRMMNLCNIHFHKNAEHSGGEFTTYAGNGDGQGQRTGYIYSGTLTAQERAPVRQAICPSDHGSLESGDTIELHYVHTTSQIQPGPTLGACLSPSIGNPQLRVETQVFVLVNDHNANDFAELTAVSQQNSYYRATGIPTDTGEPVLYAGSTTGPGYNEQGSPFQVTWSVRPEVAKVDIKTVGTWCEGNEFDENHAHGVRNLVTNPDLLSPIH